MKLTLALTTLRAVVLRGASFCEYVWITDRGKTSWACNISSLNLICERVDPTGCESCRRPRNPTLHTPHPTPRDPPIRSLVLRGRSCAYVRSQSGSRKQWG